MIATDAAALGLLDELAAALDREIDVLQQRITQLDEMNEAFTRRDNDRLDGLLAEIDRTQHDQTVLDGRVHALREKLASHYGLAVAEARLSRLEQLVPADRRAGLTARRERITALAHTVRQRNFQAALVLNETARINRLLLETLFPAEKSVTTYGQGGQDLWQHQGGMLNAEG